MNETSNFLRKTWGKTDLTPRENLFIIISSTTLQVVADHVFAEKHDIFQTVETSHHLQAYWDFIPHYSTVAVDCAILCKWHCDCGIFCLLKFTLESLCDQCELWTVTVRFLQVKYAIMWDYVTITVDCAITGRGPRASGWEILKNKTANRANFTFSCLET